MIKYESYSCIPKNYTGECRIKSPSAQCWVVNGKYHREDGPAFISDDGSVEWRLNGLTHRLDGPAIIWNNGYKSYYINNIEYSEQNFWNHPLVIANKLQRILNDQMFETKKSYKVD